MRLVLKAKIQKLAAALAVFAVITIFLFSYGLYAFGILGLVVAIYLFAQFYPLLPEELIIYSLKRNSGRMTKVDIIAEIPNKAERALQRMVKKGIVVVENDTIVLSNINQLSAFEERKRK